MSNKKVNIIVASSPAIKDAVVLTVLLTKEPVELDGEKTIAVDNIRSKYTNTVAVKSPKSGYLQYIDSELLLKAVCSIDGLIELHVRPGDHLVEDIEIGQLYTNDNY